MTTPEDTEAPTADRTVSARKLANAALVSLHEIMTEGQKVMTPTGDTVRVSPSAKHFEVVGRLLGSMGYQHDDGKEKNVLTDVVANLRRQPAPLPESQASPVFDPPDEANVPATVPIDAPKVSRH